MLANSSWCVWTAQKQSANTLANCSLQIERNRTTFSWWQTRIWRVTGLQTCVGACQPIKTRALFTWFAWHFKNGGRTWRRNLQLFNSSTTFRIVRICGTFRLQGITTQNTSGGSYRTSVFNATRVRFLLIYGFVQTFIIFQRFLFLLWRLTYNRTKTRAATLRECHCTTLAMMQI